MHLQYPFKNSSAVYQAAMSLMRIDGDSEINVLHGISHHANGRKKTTQDFLHSFCKLGVQHRSMWNAKLHRGHLVCKIAWALLFRQLCTRMQSLNLMLYPIHLKYHEPNCGCRGEKRSCNWQKDYSEGIAYQKHLIYKALHGEQNLLHGNSPARIHRWSTCQGQGLGVFHLC